MLKQSSCPANIYASVLLAPKACDIRLNCVRLGKLDISGTFRLNAKQSFCPVDIYAFVSLAPKACDTRYYLIRLGWARLGWARLGWARPG
jgi:hypothetical protein